MDSTTLDSTIISFERRVKPLPYTALKRCVQNAITRLKAVQRQIDEGTLGHPVSAVMLSVDQLVGRTEHTLRSLEGSTRPVEQLSLPFVA